MLLATAMINVIGKNGRRIEVRALLDAGADTSIISQSVVQTLGLTPHHANVALLGFSSQEPIQIRQAVDFDLANSDQTFRMSMSALVRPKLNFIIPTSQVTIQTWPHIQGLRLADPNF